MAGSLPASADPNRSKSGGWAPGRSGNPAGRPKGLPNFKTLLASLPDDEEGRRATVATTLGVRIDAVPTSLDRLGLLLWMREQQAYRATRHPPRARALPLALQAGPGPTLLRVAGGRVREQGGLAAEPALGRGLAKPPLEPLAQLLTLSGAFRR